MTPSAAVAALATLVFETTKYTNHTKKNKNKAIAKKQKYYLVTVQLHPIFVHLELLE